MVRLIFILILFLSTVKYAEGQDSLRLHHAQLHFELKEARERIDSLESLLNDKQMVAILQERALFQKIMLERQKAFIYGLIALSIL